MGIKHGCRCHGHWLSRRKSWVVTQRNKSQILGKWTASPYSELKCRICRRKWRSKASHVVQLADYAERVYAKLADEDLLDLILTGRIKADLNTGEIYKERRRNRVWTGKSIKLKQTPDKNDGYLFVDIKHNNGRRWISVSRLVWMCKHKELIPFGYDIDHRNTIFTDNRGNNLRLAESAKNQGRCPDDYF
jgi:hypothetical protein